MSWDGRRVCYCTVLQCGQFLRATTYSSEATLLDRPTLGPKVDPTSSVASLPNVVAELGGAFFAF